MKKAVLFTMLVFILLALPVPGESANAGHPELTRITAQEFKQLMDKKGDYVLVDSRDSTSYYKGHIKGAINIHYDPSGDPMSRKMVMMALPMDKPIIIYCASEDDKTSVHLALELFDMGYNLDMIKILYKGILGWKKLGYPMITAGD